MQTESFSDFLKAYGTRCPPTRIRRSGEDVAEWQRGFRQVVESLRGPLPCRVDPEPETVSTTVLEDHTRHLLRIPVSEFSTLVAYLLVPSGLPPGERRPALVASHGHVTHGIDSVCGVRGMDADDADRRAYALAAVRAGYVVLAPAWWGWTGRDGHLDRVGQRDRCNVIQMAAGMYGMNVTDLHIQDGQAALDVLAARPEVDPGRVACFGNSYGGRTTMWLAIFDERIRACVPAGCMNTFRERSLKLSSCGIQYLPGLLRFGDVPELFSLIAPRAMQLQAGETDPLITPADRDAMFATVQQTYRGLGAEANLELAMHPGGHFLLWDRADAFLQHSL